MTMPDTDNTNVLDFTEARAKELQEALTNRGVLCYVHWDRSPWGVRIPLTTDVSEYGPALYVLTEGMKQIGGAGRGHETWTWMGQLGNFGDGEFQSLLTETMFEWIERPWLDDFPISTLADNVTAIVRVLRMGAQRIAQVDSL